jgi:hypothetical protein
LEVRGRKKGGYGGQSNGRGKQLKNIIKQGGEFYGV